jgi:hypothetical protein
MVELAGRPTAVAETELAESAKGALTPSERAAVWVAVPSVAVTFTLYDPAATPCGTVTASVAVAGELPESSTLEGDTEQEGAGPEPVEVTEQLNETNPERPATGVTVTVEVALPPSETDASGVAETETCGRNGTAMLVVWDDPAPVPVTVTV